MLTDPVLQERFLEYLERHIELGGEKEVVRCTKEQPEFLEMAQFYLDQARENLNDFRTGIVVISSMVSRLWR